MFKEIGVFKVTRNQHDRFKSGELWELWSRRYPGLFDADDLRVAKTQAHHGYHFYEWLAALMIYESIGYLSLVESYEYRIQKRKQEIIKGLLPSEVLEAIGEITKSGRVQCPDLLCYAPDLSDWFFCEVKGPTDKMRPEQEEHFQALVDSSGKKIRVVRFEYFVR